MNKIFEKTAKAIHGNKLFAINFATYELEFFPITKEVQIRNVFEKYSEFECEILLQKFDWFRNLQRFKIKKVRVDVTQKGGYEITLKEKQIGFVEQWGNQFRLGFVLVDAESEEGFKWQYFKKPFDSIDEVKQYLLTYYGKLQDKFNFYIEPDDSEPEIPEEDISDDEY